MKNRGYPIPGTPCNTVRALLFVSSDCVSGSRYTRWDEWVNINLRDKMNIPSDEHRYSSILAIIRGPTPGSWSKFRSHGFQYDDYG